MAESVEETRCLVRDGPSSLELGVKMGLLRSSERNIRLRILDDKHLFDVWVNPTSLKILNPVEELWVIDGVIDSFTTTSIIQRGDKVRITYYALGSRHGELRKRRVLDKNLTQTIVTILRSVTLADTLPVGLLDYTRNMTGDVPEMFRRWVVENPEEALTWYQLRKA